MTQGQRGLMQKISFIILALMAIPSGLSRAQTEGKEVLEQKLQSKLDRILTAEEYLIDLKITPDGLAANAPAEKFLPGLQVLGPVADADGDSSRSIMLGGRADLLLILDKNVSAERSKVAEAIVSRTIEAEGLKQQVKFSSQRRDIKKTKELPVLPPPARQPSLFEQMIQEKDLVSRALLIFWGGLVSLMAIYFVLRRFLLSVDHKNDAPYSQSMAPAAPGQGLSSSELAKPSANKAEKTREELYSRQEANLNSIKEITEESKTQPKKTAKILSRWVSQSEDLSGAAALYLRNCDIKTVELICQAMHPSDLEKIIANKIEDFEPFGVENQRVIERMRADLAVLASEVVLRERPDPLNFLRRLSDEEIRNLLEGETEETIALVASQIPAHRLQKFYDSASSVSIKAIVSKLSSLRTASVGDFESLQALLSHKIQILSSNLVTEKDLAVSIQATIASIGSPSLQCELVEKLRSENPRVYEKVRPTVFLPTDLRFLPRSAKTFLVQSIDADTLGLALSGFSISFEALLDGLPLAYQSVFEDTQKRTSEKISVVNAWKKVSVTLHELTTAGLISKNDIALSIRRAEELARKDAEQDASQSGGADRGAA